MVESQFSMGILGILSKLKDLNLLEEQLEIFVNVGGCVIFCIFCI